MPTASYPPHSWESVAGTDDGLWISNRGWALIIEDAVRVYLCQPDGLPLSNDDGELVVFRGVTGAKSHADRSQGIRDSRPETREWVMPSGQPLLQPEGATTIVGCCMGPNADHRAFEFRSRTAAELFRMNILRLQSASGSGTHN